jgi:hypothetical protein
VASWSQYLDDPASPEITRLGPFQVASLAYSAARRLGFQEPALVPGLAHRLMLDLAMSTTAAASITLRLAYMVFPLDGSLAASLTTDLWRASWTPGASKKIVALASDGWREYTAGASGATGGTAPTWPTSGTVSDGTVTWTAGNVIYKNLSLTYSVSDSASEPFRVDSASLTIPAAEITADNQQIVGFLLREVGSGHTGDLYLLDGHFKALEG